MRIGWIVISGILLSVCLSCTNPFNTRTPEEPASDEPPTNTPLQNDPGTILDKIQLAFREKDIRLYSDCLADPSLVNASFIFLPEAQEISRFSNWTKADEINYFNNLVNNDTLIQVKLEYNIETFKIIAQDTVQIDFSYSITAEFRKKTESYQGRSILDILESSASLWYIFRWVDLRLDTDALIDGTWSTLKANYQ